MSENEVSIICISNGSGEYYPENTLTSFRNKLPKSFQWRKNGVYRYHIAVESIGLSSNFISTKLPNKKENPSFILGVPLKWPEIVKQTLIETTNQLITDETVKESIQNTCHGIKTLPTECNTTILDPYLNSILNEDPEAFCLEYFFLENENMTIAEYVKVFENIVEQSDNTLEMIYNKESKIIDIKSIGTFKTNLVKGGVSSATHLFIHKSLFFNLKVKYNQYVQPSTSEFTEYRRNLLLFNENHMINNEEYFRIYLHRDYQSISISLESYNKKHYPNIIKIQCEQIKSQIFDNTHSRDLACFHPDFPEKDLFFFHEIEKKQYFPLENTILDELEFHLVDENNQSLNLNEGIATVLKLRLKEMSYYKKSFNVRLTSRKTKNNPKNTNSEFTVDLPQTLFLDETWNVSVSNINLPNVFATLPPNNYIQVIVKNDDGTTSPYKYFCKSERFEKNELISGLNRSFYRITKGERIIAFDLELNQNEFEEKLVISIFKPNVILQISKDLCQLLGYGAEDYTRKNDLEFKVFKINAFNPGEYRKTIQMSNPLQIDYFQPSYAMLYSNIVKPSIIGSTYANILKIFPTFNDEKTYTIRQFKDPEHFSLLNNEIKSITLSFKNHAGEALNFAKTYNIVIVDLTFSNYV